MKETEPNTCPKCQSKLVWETGIPDQHIGYSITVGFYCETCNSYYRAVYQFSYAEENS